MAVKTDKSLLSASVQNEWKGRLSNLSYGREKVRFWWVGGSEKTQLDGWVEAFSWDDLVDASPVLTGSMSLRQSLSYSPIPPIHQGDLIICEMQTTPADQWSELVRLRVSEPQRLASGQFTFQLSNDAALLALGTDSWHFPHNATHKGGWFPWEVVEFVCKRAQIRCVMPRIGSRMKKFPPMINSSPIDVINAAMKHVRDTERKTLIRRFEAATLYLSQRHYSPELMTLGPQLIDASLVETKKEGWATALTVRTLKEVVHTGVPSSFVPKTHQGIVVEVPTRKKVAKSAYVKRFGYVHLVVYAHGATSVTEARNMGLAHLARVLQPNRTITLTTPLIRGLRRGAYVRLAIPTLGLTQIVYVQSISYSLSIGSITMDVTCGFEDPQATPPVDRVNQSTKNLVKKTNLAVNSSKKDKQTGKPAVITPTLGGHPTA